MSTISNATFALYYWPRNKRILLFLKNSPLALASFLDFCINPFLQANDKSLGNTIHVNFPFLPHCILLANILEKFAVA